MAGWLRSLSITCPTCGALPHRPCNRLELGLAVRKLPFSKPHQSRIEAAAHEVKTVKDLTFREVRKWKT